MSRSLETIPLPAIQDLQQRLFQHPIYPDDLAALLDSAGQPSTASGLSYDGFLTLLKELICRGRVATIWEILRFYGYDRSLHLSERYLHPKLDMRADGSELVELSEEGWSFVRDLWEEYTQPESKAEEEGQEQQRVLSSEGMQLLFRPCHAIPFDERWREKGLSLDMWLAQWAYVLSRSSCVSQQLISSFFSFSALAYTNPQLLLATLAELGYPQSVSPSAPSLTTKRGKTKSDANALPLSAIKAVNKQSTGKRGKSASRKTFGVLVFGEKICRTAFQEAVYAQGGDVLIHTDSVYTVVSGRLPVTPVLQLRTDSRSFTSCNSCQTLRS